MGKRKGKRRWFQFSLRLMFLVITLCAVLLGLRMWQVRQRQQAVDAVRKLGGSVLLGREAPVPNWLRPLVFPKVIVVDLDGAPATDADLARLSGLKDLQTLKLGHTQVTGAGLEHLAGLTELQTLLVPGTAITDADLVNLERLGSLINLDLSRTRITDEGLRYLGRLSRLEELHLFETQVTDAGLRHLAGLSRLKRLSLEERHITAAGVKHLKRLASLQTIVVHVPSGLGKRARDLLRPLANVQSCGISRPDVPAIWEAANPWEITPAGVAEVIASRVELTPAEFAALLEVLAKTCGPFHWSERRPPVRGPGPTAAEQQQMQSVEGLVQAVQEWEDHNFWPKLYRGESGIPAGAIPALLELLEQPDVEVQQRAAYLLGRAGGGDRQVAAALGRMLEDENPGLRALGAYALAEMGPKMAAESAEAVVPLLLRGLKDQYYEARCGAATALGRISQANPQQTKAAIPLLLGIIQDQDAMAIPEALHALDRIVEADPREAKPAVAALLRMYRNATAQAKPDVADAMGHVARHDAEQAGATVPVLIGMLDDKNARLRYGVAGALEHIAERRPELFDTILPVFLCMLQDQDQSVRRAAAAALENIVEHQPEQLKTILPELIRMLQDKDESVRFAAERPLAGIARVIYTESVQRSTSP